MASSTRAAGPDQSRRSVRPSPAGLLGSAVGLVFTLIGRLFLALFLIAEAAVNAVADLFTRPAKALAATEAREQYVVRFDLHQRIQHVLMFSSFFTLAFTGLPQKFHDWAGSQWLIAALGGLEMAQQIHHIAAYVMLFDCLYHGLYLCHGILVRRQLKMLQMIPMPKDVLDAFQMFKYFFGLSDEKPRFHRFSYLEKFDYWAVFWGIAIIGGSGLVLLFPVQVSRLVPGGIVPVALVAHSDEALLAVGWIFIVHLFYVHFAPAVFPFNPSIFTGRVAKRRYAEEHPLEYERLYGDPDDNQHVVHPARQVAPAAVSSAAPSESDRLPDEES